MSTEDEWVPCSGCNGMRSALCADCEAAWHDAQERKLAALVVEAREVIESGRDGIAVSRAARDQAEALLAEMRGKGMQA